MPFHIIKTGDKWNVENASTHEVKNKEPYDNEADAQAYSNALNAHSPEGKSETIVVVAGPTTGGASEAVNIAETTPSGSITFVTEDGSIKTVPVSGEIAEAFKAISKREDVNPKAGVSKYGDVTFADEKNKKYPLDSESHIRSAWNYFGMPKNQAKYSASEVATIKGKIVAAWKDKIDKEGPPSAKSLDLSYIKSLGIEIPEGLAAKYVSRDMIRHPVIVWGNSQQTDVEREFFTPQSDFWDEQYKDVKRPLTWDHAQDAEYKDENPIVGVTLEYEDDDVARWAISKLERNRRYRKAIDRLVEEGALGSSTDSVPQYILRQKAIDGKTWTKSGAGDLWTCEEDGTSTKSLPRAVATWLKRWPWVASALTDVPCEPRMNGSVEWFKSLGVDLPDVPDLERLHRAMKIRYLKLFIP